MREGVPTLDWGGVYLPWMGMSTYLGWGGEVPTLDDGGDEVPTLDGGGGTYLGWGRGTYLGWGKGVSTLDKGRGTNL